MHPIVYGASSLRCDDIIQLTMCHACTRMQGLLSRELGCMVCEACVVSFAILIAPETSRNHDMTLGQICAQATLWAVLACIYARADSTPATPACQLKAVPSCTPLPGVFADQGCALCTSPFRALAASMQMVASPFHLPLVDSKLTPSTHTISRWCRGQGCRCVGEFCATQPSWPARAYPAAG